MTARPDSTRLIRTVYPPAGAVILAALALSLTHLLAPRFGGVLYFASSLAVTVAALLFGIGPGLLATAVSAAGYADLFLSGPYERSRFLLFVSACSIVSLVCGWHHRRSQQLRQERERAQAAQEDARRLAQRLGLSQSITSDLAVAWTQADVATVLVNRGLEAFGAKAISVSVPISDEELDIIHHVGHPTDTVTRFRVRIDSDTPRAEAYRGGEGVWLESPGEVARHYPHLEERLRGDGAWAAVPMIAHGRPLGVFTLTFAEPRSFNAEERHFISFVASKYGQALERARLYEAERVARSNAETAYEAEKVARSRAETAEDEARRVGALQEQLVAIVSHDLRNPLGAIIAAVATLKKRRRDMDSREASTIALLARSAERMQGIIGGVLDLAHTRRGGSIQVKREPIRLSDVCRHVIAELEQAKPGRAIQLHVEKDDEGEWDPGRLAQLVSNLAANAVQHSPADAAVEVRIRGSQQNLVLEVHDSGPPIPSDVLVSVFEPFVKGTSPRDKPNGNIGLGLYIVREIARAHQGTVDVCSRAGHGTSFVVKLPRWTTKGTAHASLH